MKIEANIIKLDCAYKKGWIDGWISTYSEENPRVTVYVIVANNTEIEYISLPRIYSPYILALRCGREFASFLPTAFHFIDKLITMI